MAHYGKVTVRDIMDSRPLRLEVAGVLGKTEGELLKNLEDEDEKTRLEVVFDDPVPDDLEYTTVSEARGDIQRIARIAKYTGREATSVSEDLELTHGAKLVRNLFEFQWLERPRSDEKGAGRANPSRDSTKGAKTRSSRDQGTGIGSARSGNNKVFLVHGHDDAAKQTVARFLERLKLSVIVLHEQTNRGKTIIEKFEENSDVAFAVVLLTPDDRGQAASSDGEPPRHRARQNVIFELGFFMGKLGRNRVCALHKTMTEIPSDLSGILYVPMEGSWQWDLARELKQAIPTVDLNNAL